MTAEPHCEGDWKLTQEQKDEILADYAAAKRGEVVDALTALEEIRIAYGFPKDESPSPASRPTEQVKPHGLTEDQKREILRGWNEALQGNYVDMETALEEIRTEHNF